MKKLGLILLGSAICFAMVTGVFAESTDSTASTTTKTTAKKASVMHATGTVTEVDATANTITIQGKKSTMTFTAGSKVKVADIAKDSKVTVTYTKSGDKLTASSVKAVTTKKKTTTSTTSNDTTKM